MVFIYDKNIKKFNNKKIVFHDNFIFLLDYDKSIGYLRISNDMCEIAIINDIYYNSIVPRSIVTKYLYEITEHKIISYYKYNYGCYHLCNKNNYLKFIYTTNKYNYNDSVVENNKFYLNGQIYDHNFKNITFNSYFNKKILMPADIKMIFY